MLYLFIVENSHPLPTNCEDTWYSDCSKFAWACNDPRFPWFEGVCSKTCGVCSGKGINKSYRYLINDTYFVEVISMY